MFCPVKMVDLELTELLQTLDDLDEYQAVKGLVRLCGTPLGYVEAPVQYGLCSGQELKRLVILSLKADILRELLLNHMLATQVSYVSHCEDLSLNTSLPAATERPFVTVAVCTRNRIHHIPACLQALMELDYPNLEVLAVDNAPETDELRRLLEAFPGVRYVVEDRPGLNWARNKAILEARGEIIAFTDDDVQVDRRWVSALTAVFVEHPEVMAVTGLVVPLELETEAQALFEYNGGFGRGFRQRWFCISGTGTWRSLATANCGTGANMAFRRCVFKQTRPFDPALDLGTVINGAGDLEMFYRIQKTGHVLAYEPRAIVRHQHRRTYRDLCQQIYNNGSIMSYFCRTAKYFPEEKRAVLRMIASCTMWYSRRLLKSLKRSEPLPWRLVMHEISGGIAGLRRYSESEKTAAFLAERFSHLPTITTQAISVPRHCPEKRRVSATAIHRIDLAKPLEPLQVSNCDRVRIDATYRNSCVGSWEIATHGCHLSRSRLYMSLVDNLGILLLEPDNGMPEAEKWLKIDRFLERVIQTTSSPAPAVRNIVTALRS